MKYASETTRLMLFTARKSQLLLDKAMLIISIDVDAFTPKLAEINSGKNDRNVHNTLSELQVGTVDEWALPLFLDVFDKFGVPATFALRGQLTEVDPSETNLHLFKECHVKHDLGAHGYYHRKFGLLNHEEAELELKGISDGFKKIGLDPKSFVFPANSVNHLDLLEKYGYECYRGLAGVKQDTLSIEKRGNLYDVRSSFYFTPEANLALTKRLLNLAVSRKLPFHIWFHLWNFGLEKTQTQTNINKLMIPLLSYAKVLEQAKKLSFQTMLSAARIAKQEIGD